MARLGGVKGATGVEGTARSEDTYLLAFGFEFPHRFLRGLIGLPLYLKHSRFFLPLAGFQRGGVAGLGLLSINEYYATYTEEGGVPSASLGTAIKKNKVPVNLGLGMDFFVSSSVAVKIDARSYLYLDKKPQYDPDVAVEESRLYNNFIASAGVSVFFPKMKPRQYDF